MSLFCLSSRAAAVLLSTFTLSFYAADCNAAPGEIRDQHTRLPLSQPVAQSIVPIVHEPKPDVDPCIVVDDEVRHDSEPGFTIEDQLRLADFGRTDPNGAAFAAEIFTVSPDGAQVALLVNRANPEVNAYCQRLLLVPIEGGGKEVELDRGGEFLRADFRLRDFSVVYGGYQKSNPPLWSPNGSNIAFLKKTNGMIQVWVVAADGRSPSRQASNLQDDINRFIWSPDGSGLIVETRPTVRKQAEAIGKEAHQGFLFDQRFSPQFADRPIPTGDIEFAHSYVLLEGGNTRAATTDEVKLLNPPLTNTASPKSRHFKTSSTGHEAWTEPKNSDLLISPSQLVIKTNQGPRYVCDDELCEGIFRTWWSNHGDTLFALQRTGWGNSQSALLRWRIREDRPERLVITDDMLFGCSMASQELVCAQEGATRPRHLIAINPDTGEERVIYNPNPSFEDADFGEVTRLKLKNELGVESYADLVLPRDRTPGQKFPLVVVGYRTDGFLRGGTGDEVPIHPLTNRGIAVLSYQRPFLWSVDSKARTEKELMRANREQWRDRKSVQSSLEIGIQLAVETGSIDPDRLGISGFSDGVATAQWALINSDLFEVAALAVMAEDKYSYFLQAGPHFTDVMRESGYKVLEDDPDGFWKPYSLMMNVDHVDAAIMIQAPDTEYSGSLDVFEVYSHAGKPVEMYVFEDEAHVKWQPAHREAMYRRNLQWLRFWLQDEVDSDPVSIGQYDRWQAMRAEHCANIESNGKDVPTYCAFAPVE